MKVISFTVLNNEADIIESFVRYNMTYVDKMIILDNGCTDNTIKILKLLQQEGYDIEIFNESRVGFEQYVLMNKYLRIVSEEYESDWIIPLDADEMLMSDDKPIRAALEELPRDRIYKIYWRQFVMNDEDDPKETFVCRRMKHSFLHKIGKVIIPTSMVKKCDLILQPGQHSVVSNEKVWMEETGILCMAHYPHRSFEQSKTKALCHSVRYVNYLGRQNGESVHRNYFANQCVMHLSDDNDKWFFEAIRERTFKWGIDVIKSEIHPVNLKLQQIEDVEMKYSTLAICNAEHSLYRLSLEMALKSYDLRMESILYNRNMPIILVYGTGGGGSDRLKRIQGGPCTYQSIY